MSTVKRVGEKTRYDFVDVGCIGRECFAPGMFQHRSPMSCGGSRNTGSPDTPCCLNRAYRGCPRGPVGEKHEACFECLGGRTIENETCVVCGGSGQITVSGLPVVVLELKKRRAGEGWRVTR